MAPCSSSITAAASTPTINPPLARVPLVPPALLARHACIIPGDTRFRAAARLRQALWRQAQGLPAGLHRPGTDRDAIPLPLGSLLKPADAARGLNFLSPAVHAFVRRSLAFREEGACVNTDRLFRNLLSSEPLTYSLFVPLALDRDLATAVFRQLLPGFVHQVTGIRFETSPSRDRHDPRYLMDGTAFDAAISVITPYGEPATVFVEVKYSEGCSGPASAHRPRYDEASRELALHRDPEARVLRSTQLEQFFRLHMLAQLCVQNGVTPRAHLLVLSPALNRRVGRATERYAAELTDPAGSSPETVGFTALTLETFVATLAQAGGGAEAGYLAHRYLDFTPVLDLVLADLDGPGDEPPPAGPMLALPAPSSVSADDNAEPVDAVALPRSADIVGGDEPAAKASSRRSSKRRRSSAANAVRIKRTRPAQASGKSRHPKAAGAAVSVEGR